MAHNAGQQLDGGSFKGAGNPVLRKTETLTIHTYCVVCPTITHYSVICWWGHRVVLRPPKSGLGSSEGDSRAHRWTVGNEQLAGAPWKVPYGD